MIAAPRQPSRFMPFLRAGALVLAGVFLFLVFLALGYRLVYAGRIMPGVSVGGVDLSGLRVDAAAERLSAQLTYPTAGRLAFTDGSRLWEAHPADVGFLFDYTASAREAFDLGRRGGLFGGLREALYVRRHPRDLAPVVLFNQAQAYIFLQQIAAEIDAPPREASLRLEGLNVIWQDGQTGRMMNVDVSLAALTMQLMTLSDGVVTLAVESRPPQVAEAARAAAQTQAALSAPLTLTLPDDETTRVLKPETLAQWMVFPPQDGAYQAMLNPALLTGYLNDLAEDINRTPQNARFIFNDETRQLDLIRSAVTGRTLDVEASLTRIQQAIQSGQHQVVLAVSTHEPDVGDSATAADLGITELVATQASYFRGSSGDRIQNIQTAAGEFHGLLVPPGGVLSMAEVLQDISLDNGYAEALIIYNGRTIKGVGGGVCQVSTTLFRTAFFGGYPILERHAHAYRVYYYEQSQYGYDSSLAGLDATVYIPVVDFKFQNDTPYWLLMETYVNVGARRLTWKFYSTSDGRSVEWTTTGLQNIVPAPEPKFIENPELPKGKMRQVDWAAEGADVTVTRDVYRRDELLFSDVFETHYQPWAAVCEYASDVDNPEGTARELGLCQP